MWAFLVGRILKVSVCVCLFCFATYAYYPPFIEFFWVVTFYFTMFCLWYYPSLLTPNIYVQSRWVEDLLEFESILLFSRSFYKISLSNYSSVNFFFSAAPLFCVAFAWFPLLFLYFFQPKFTFWFYIHYCNVTWSCFGISVWISFVSITCTIPLFILCPYYFIVLSFH